MTEEEYDAIMSDYDKQFGKLIPKHPEGTYLVPLLEQLEIHTSPEMDGWVEELCENNEGIELWYPIKLGPEQGLSRKRVVIHSQFVAMNCVMANKEGKLDFGFKNAEDGQIYKTFQNGEWKEPVL